MMLSGLVLFLVFLKLERVTSIKPQLVRKYAGISDLSFYDNLVFVLNGVSDVDCARLCVMSSLCATFTYDEGSGMCRGHSKVMTRLNSHFDSPGSIGFLVDWLKMGCSAHSECTVPMSGCFGAYCVCTLGYFYSYTSKTCLQACPPENLQDEFIKYPNFDVVGNDIYFDITGTVTVEQCQAMCVSTPRCLTITYVNRGCYLKDVTATMSPSSVQYSAGTNHYQRLCA